MIAVVTACTAPLLILHAVSWAWTLPRLGATLQPPAPQSTASLALAVVMLRVAAISNRRARAWSAATLLFVFVVATLLLPLPLEYHGFTFMGDGRDFAEARSKFEANIPAAGSVPALHVKSHLADAALASIDWSLGRTDTSPALAYQRLSRLGGVLFALELLGIVVLLRGRRRAVRYCALALALPVAIGFFGYYEAGYMAVSAGAYPLLVCGLRRRFEFRASAAGALQGLHAAFHGFGLLGIVGGVCAAAVTSRNLARGASVAMRFATAAVALYAGWFAVYVIGFKLSVQADSAASNVALRALTDTLTFDRRVMHPLASSVALVEIGAASLAVGVPLLAYGAMSAPSGRIRARALAYSAPALAFLVLWWPSLGVSADMDLLLGAFAGAPAAAWLASRTPRTAAWGTGILVAAHMFFWSAVVNPSLRRIWIS